jgi:hypothetical protein
MQAAADKSYESVALSVLVHEYPFSRKGEADNKIKARLKRRGLGAFDAARVETLRRLKDDVQREIGRQAASPYYTVPASEQSAERYVDMRDFDLGRLTKDLIARHPGVPAQEIEWFVPFATFIYHML